MTFSLRTAIASVLMALFATTSFGQPGSYSKASTTDEGVIAAAKFAVETQSKKEPVTLIKILSAESQVVAGRNIRMTLEVRTKSGVHQALAVVWNKLDRTRELTTWEIKPGAGPEKKGDDTLDGGYVNIATTDKGVETAANFAIEAQSKNAPVRLVKIEKAETQVVAGKNYRMTLEVRQGRMPKPVVVVAVVWAKLDGTHQLTSWTPKGNAAPVDPVPNVGGYSGVSTTDAGVVAAAKFAIEAHSKKEPVALVKIEKAETQVVAGSNTMMLLEVRTQTGLRLAEAVVWHKIDGTQELTKWEWKSPAAPKKKGK